MNVLITLFRFVKKAAPLAQKSCAASPTAAVSDPAGNGFGDWRHLMKYLLRVHMGATYREIANWDSKMDLVRAALQLTHITFPAPLRLWRSFQRVLTLVWSQLLDRLAARYDPGENGVLDATFYDCETASSHYIDRSDRHIEMKTTALVESDPCAVLDVHCSVHWPHYTQVGRLIALRNTDNIESLARNKCTTTSYHGMSFGQRKSNR